MARGPQFKIISGGQTGADRAALDVALALGIPAGGWCPADRRAEDGPIDKIYPLTPLPGAGYRQRTRKNVQDSDATAIFAFGPLTGGSKATANDCTHFKKPHIIIDADQTTEDEAALLLAVFLLRHHVKTLNVAGPRASNQPEIYEFVATVLTEVFKAPPKRKSRR